MKKELIQIEKSRKVYAGQTLSRAGEKAYWQILEALNHVALTVYFPKSKYKEFLDIYLALSHDYPELCFFWDYGNSYLQGDVLHFKYYYEEAAVRQKLLQIQNAAEQIICKSVRPQMTDRDRIQSVYTCLAQELHYTSEFLAREGEYPHPCYTLETLIQKHGVCGGISMCFVYLMKQLQIEVLYVLGDVQQNSEKYSGAHAWNQVMLEDGQVFHLDLTWDLGKAPEKIRYLFLDDSGMQKASHSWNQKLYPKAAQY